MTTDNFQSFKYKAFPVRKTKDAVGGTNSSVKDAKIVVPLKYSSNVWRTLQIPLISWKVYLELNWIEDYILSSAGNSEKFEIKDAKLHFPIFTFSTKDSANLTRQLTEGFKRSVYWNSYETRTAKVIKHREHLSELLNALFQGVRRLLVLAYAIAACENDEAGIKTIKSIFF